MKTARGRPTQLLAEKSADPPSRGRVRRGESFRFPKAGEPSWVISGNKSIDFFADCKFLLLIHVTLQNQDVAGAERE